MIARHIAPCYLLLVFVLKYLERPYVNTKLLAAVIFHILEEGHYRPICVEFAAALRVANRGWPIFGLVALVFGNYQIAIGQLGYFQRGCLVFL